MKNTNYVKMNMHLLLIKVTHHWFIWSGDDSASVSSDFMALYKAVIFVIIIIVLKQDTEILW